MEDGREEKGCQRDFAVLQGALSGDGEANTEAKASETDPDNGEEKAQTKVAIDTVFCSTYICTWSRMLTIAQLIHCNHASH